MRKLLVLIFIGLGLNQLKAQDNTLGNQPSTFDTLFYFIENSKLVIVPFEPKLYKSQIDRQIGEANGLNFQEVRGYFRLGLDNALFIEAKQKYDVVRMHADVGDVNQDLHYIYKTSGYEYRALPETEIEDQRKWMRTYYKISSKIKLPQEEKPTGTFMQNGQLVNNPDKEQKFMARTLLNPEVIEYLNEKYSAGLYLFINQFDIIHYGDDWTELAEDNFSREIKIHYSIFTKEKTEVYSGVALAYFSASNNNLKDIITQNFPILAQQIIQKVPVLVVRTSEGLLTD